MSKQRQAVLQVLNEGQGHMTAEEIFFEVRKLVPSISYSTVYRNLGVLSDENEIHKITLPSDSDVFDKTPSSHGHLICKKCKHVTDMPFEITNKAIESLNEQGIEVSNYCFMAEFICKDCQE